MKRITDLCRALYEAVVCGDCRQSERVAHDALAAEADAAELFTGGVIPAMHEAQRRFRVREFYVPEMLMACRAMRAAMSRIEPSLAAKGFKPAAHLCVIGLTHGPHDATTWLVADMLEGAGFKVTRGTLGVPEPQRAGQWRIAETAAALLVAPTMVSACGSASRSVPDRSPIENLLARFSASGCKTVFVGGDSYSLSELPFDAWVDDFADVVPVVERLIHPDEAAGATREAALEPNPARAQSCGTG